MLTDALSSTAGGDECVSGDGGVPGAAALLQSVVSAAVGRLDSFTTSELTHLARACSNTTIAAAAEPLAAEVLARSPSLDLPQLSSVLWDLPRHSLLHIIDAIAADAGTTPSTTEQLCCATIATLAAHADGASATTVSQIVSGLSRIAATDVAQYPGPVLLAVRRAFGTVVCALREHNISRFTATQLAGLLQSFIDFAEDRDALVCGQRLAVSVVERLQLAQLLVPQSTIAASFGVLGLRQLELWQDRCDALGKDDPQWHRCCLPPVLRLWCRSELERLDPPNSRQTTRKRVHQRQGHEVGAILTPAEHKNKRRASSSS